MTILQDCLFNIASDPCELDNALADFPSVVAALRSALSAHAAASAPSRRRDPDPRADPGRWGGRWTSWMDEVDPESKEEEGWKRTMAAEIGVRF